MLRPGTSAAGSGWLTSRCGRTGGIPLAGHRGRGTAVAPGTPNPVTGKRSPGRGYAAATVVHCESVLRGFYAFHLEAGTGPMVNPFPLARGRRGAGRTRITTRCSRSPAERAGRYRPKLARRVPRQIPDEKFGELFALLGSHRDRALVAFWVSTGARASELLGATAADADPGQQLITVIRKGTRQLQQLPASPDAFVWLRLYQAQMHGLVPAGRDQPLWWTLRRPFRALTYDAARAMFARASAALGANWSLHDLRHSAAYRMARDPAMPLADLQWVMGHAHLSTTQQYLNPLAEDVIEAVLAFHARQREHAARCAAGTGVPGREPAGLVRQGRAVTCGWPAAGGLRGARPGQAGVRSLRPARPARSCWPGSRRGRLPRRGRRPWPPGSRSWRGCWRRRSRWTTRPASRAGGWAWSPW